MSPTRKPSTVTGLRRGVAGPTAAEFHAADRRNAPTPERPPRPEKPVRFTLDLDRDRHQFLKEHAVSIGADASQVMRALLDELRDDADLQGRIWTRIWQPR